MNLGSWKIDDLVTFPANTHNPTNGVATAADAVPSYHVYEDETATPLITGTMSTLNSPNTIGFYTEQIQLLAATGFEKGKSYSIYICAVVAGFTGTMSHAFQIEAEVDANTVSTPVGINTGTFLSAIADVVWDELLSGHLVPGSAGHTLISRMPSGTVIVSQNQDKTGYSLSSPQTFDLVGNISGTWVGNIQGNLSGTVGQLLDITAALANKIADHTIRRTFANARASSDGDAVTFRSLLGAIAKLVNRWNISGSTLTVYAEDDATSIGTQTATGDASAEPITQLNTD